MIQFVAFRNGILINQNVLIMVSYIINTNSVEDEQDILIYCNIRYYQHINQTVFFLHDATACIH